MRPGVAWLLLGRFCPPSVKALARKRRKNNFYLYELNSGAPLKKNLVHGPFCARTLVLS